jgi:hypothetical protein
MDLKGLVFRDCFASGLQPYYFNHTILSIFLTGVYTGWKIQKLSCVIVYLATMVKSAIFNVTMKEPVHLKVIIIIIIPMQFFLQ